MAETVQVFLHIQKFYYEQLLEIASKRIKEGERSSPDMVAGEFLINALEYYMLQNIDVDDQMSRRVKVKRPG